MKHIGIVGGGQLGRMMAMEAGGLDISISVLDPTPECPASAYAKQTVGDFTDKNTVLQFAEGKDVLTFEIESANADALRELEEQGMAVHPSPKTLSIIKDKFAQKEFLVQHRIPTAPYALVSSSADIEVFGETHGYPLVLKSRFGAYDGRGNRTLNRFADIAPAMEELGEYLYVEANVPFEREVAVVAARGQDGAVHSFPVAETVHKDHICDAVIAPARVSAEVESNAKELAATVLEVFDGVGVFGIEMFVTPNGDVLINEIAPRVHNSGHFTLGGCSISQFAQHMRAVAGEELFEPAMTGKSAAMTNILGARRAPADPQGVEEVEKMGATVVIYGKHETKPKRKMGHITVVADSADEAYTKAKEARSRISI